VQHWFTYPLTVHPYEPAFVRPEAIMRIATAAETAGFGGIGFTDHPAPSQKWLAAGGHDALDPFVVLAAIAARTTRLRLIPNIVVLPYRNPFVVAKAAATLDLVSDGRFVLSVAAGYLRSEYRALGVDFERRNALFDDSLVAIRRAWTEDSFTFEGDGFTAVGVTANPKPAHIPIWIGGNSALSRRRVAAHGDGWNPFPASAQLAQSARTVPLEGLEDLLPMLDDLWVQLDRAGRDRREVDVTFTTSLAGPASPGFNAEQHLAALGDLAAAGVTWASTTIPGGSVEQAVEAIERYGRDVIGRQR
jgi:probable F420-dependent oxidoreductase